jgi:hypothetical protein
MDSSSEVVKKKFIRWDELASKWFHSRKVAIYLVVMVVASIALFLKFVDGGQWTDITKWATSGYMAGNALDGIGDALKSKGS